MMKITWNQQTKKPVHESKNLKKSKQSINSKNWWQFDFKWHLRSLY